MNSLVVNGHYSFFLQNTQHSQQNIQSIHICLYLSPFIYALEIRLGWAGKGTTTIPFGSVYGPLISVLCLKQQIRKPKKS